MAKLTVDIGGERHEIDLADALHIHNADQERHTVAADVAWWGALAASAVAHAAKLNTAAAKHFNRLIAAALAHDAKVSEWKAKALAGADETYNELLDAAADAESQAATAQTIHWSLIRKGDMLREMIKGDNGTQRNSHDIGRAPGPPDARFNDFRNHRHRKSGEQE